MHNKSISRPNVGVFIGRFQPFHRGHESAIRMALGQVDTLLVIVGSANEPRTGRNPFTASERVAMIRENFPGEDRLVVVPLEDSDYNITAWIEQVHALVHDTARDSHGNMRTPKIILVGHDKDSSSYYLDLFPRWDFLDTGHHELLSATSVRSALFDHPPGRQELLEALENGDTNLTGFMTGWAQQARVVAMQAMAPGALAAQMLPEASRRAAEMFIAGAGFDDVAYEVAHAAWTQFQWRHSPHPPQFNTADAVVIHCGHVLMVKRRGWPGRGQWALPGGFVEANEFIQDAALRELKEETGIKLPMAVLKGHIRARETFDAPWRSSRGRTITRAFLIELSPGPAPRIREGGDEESSAVKWIALGQLKRAQCFEDHYAIIRNMAARI